MKTFSKIIGIVILSTVFVSCSSVKVTDSWKDIKSFQLNDKSILVLNKTKDNTVRTHFETDIVEQLSKQGYKSIESYKMFPVINTENKLTNEQLNTFKKELTDIGIDIVVMTVLKSVDEYTETSTSGGVYYVNTHPRIYHRGYYRSHYRGFYRYYNTVQIDLEPVTTTTKVGKKYVLETLIYDLSQPKNYQLMSVITSVIDNPESMGTTSQDFSKKMVNELVK